MSFDTLHPPKCGMSSGEPNLILFIGSADTQWMILAMFFIEGKSMNDQFDIRVCTNAYSVEAFPSS